MSGEQRGTTKGFTLHQLPTTLMGGWAEGGLVNHIQMELLLLALSYQHTNIIVTI